jgi:Fe-Mn family superoxide dismutase
MPKNRVRFFERTLHVCQFRSHPPKLSPSIDAACARRRWLALWLAKSSFGGRRAAHSADSAIVSEGRTAMTYAMKPLSCDPNRIRGMSERMIISHYENNYGGAVKRLNLIDEKLAELDYASAPGFLVNGLKREQLIATNSMILHEVFFDSLGDESEPGSTLKDVLARDFGSYDRWRAEFIAMGKALGGGSGWVLLTWSPRDRKLTNQWASDHCHTMAGGTSILALDMYEHSYHMDYGAKAASYVDVFMAAINWPAVQRAHEGLQK